MEFNKWLQSRLTAHGFPVGPIDGKVGDKTVAAIKAFEEKNGLKIDGVADDEVVKALRGSASSVSPEVAASIPDRNEEFISTPAQGAVNNWPRQSGVTAFYGPHGESQTQIEVPYGMVLAWDKSIKVHKITIHKKCAPSAKKVLEWVAGHYSQKEIIDLGLNLFGGSLNVRKMRGGNSYSMHSWGIAIDFDPERNQLSWNKEKARLGKDDAIPLWQAWEKEGWLSLGRARDYDWMHVQAAQL